MRNTDLSLKKLESMARLLVPQLLFLFLFLLSLTFLPLPYVGTVKPFFVLMAVYYWAIYRPTLVPPFLCFATGLLMDVLSGMPIGLNALALVVAQWIVRDQRRFLMGQPYIVIWAVFGFVAFIYAVMQWVLFGFFHMQWLSFTPVLAAIFLSLFLFPFVTLLLVFTHKFLPVASRAIP